MDYKSQARALIEIQVGRLLGENFAPRYESDSITV